MSEEYDYKPKTTVDAGSAEYGDQMHRVNAGETVNLAKKDPSVKKIIVGLGWDFKSFDADPPDLDASVFLLNKDDMTREDEDFVFYNNPMGADGFVQHRGDSRTGAGDGDDEQIEINLAALPFEVVRLAFAVSIYNLDSDVEDHNFDMVRNVYFRVVNRDTEHELFRFELDEHAEGMHGTAIFIGYLDRIGPEWHFTAKGDDVEGGLAKFAGDYGIQVMQTVRA